jgi:hypothetical protein
VEASGFTSPSSRQSFSNFSQGVFQQEQGAEGEQGNGDVEDADDQQQE